MIFNSMKNHRMRLKSPRLYFNSTKNRVEKISADEKHHPRVKEEIVLKAGFAKFLANINKLGEFGLF